MGTMRAFLRWDKLRLWLCVAAALTIAYAGDSATPAGAGDGASVMVPEELPGDEMPSIDEATELVRRIEASIAKGDESVLREAVDWDLICSRAMSGIDTPEDLQTGFCAGIVRGITKNGGLPKQVVQQVMLGGNYRLLDVRQKNGEMRALFRLLLPEAGVNYQDLLLVRGKDGRVRVGDIHVFLSAEDLSATFRRFYLVMVAEKNRSLLEKLSGKTAEYANHANDIAAMVESVRAGQFEEALETYESLPEALQADKMTLLVRFQAAAGIGGIECIQAVRDFKRHHPEDTCVDFLSVDLYTETGEFDKALECIDRVDESVGGDPYLNVVRSRCLASAKRFEEARQTASAAIEAEPDVIQAYWGMVGLALEMKDFKEVTRWLDHVAANFEVEFDDLTQLPEYAEYARSPDYQKWLESRTQKPLESDPLVQ